MIHNAVLAACDASDGVKDGVLENPTKCNFDYGTLACKGPDAPTCLTAPQVESAKVLTSPFKNEATGAVLYEGHLWPGAELEWGTLGGPEPLANSVARVRNFHLKDPAFEFRLPNMANDIERAARMDGGLLASNDFNLKPFFDRGGKLIMYHGWGDPQVPGRDRRVRQDGRDHTVGRAGKEAQRDRRVALNQRPGRQDAPAVPVWTGREVQRHWQHQRSRQLFLRGRTAVNAGGR